MIDEVAGPALVVLVGPQASGKSTIARALGDALRQDGRRVAVVELDAIAEMALPTLPSWDDALEILTEVVAGWMRTPLDVVVAEGVGSRDEVARVLARAGVASTVTVVAVTTTLEVALARATADPTRVLSRQRDFMTGVYAAWSGELARLAPDVVIDSTALRADAAVRRIREHIPSPQR